jgi:hypothetical protein
LISILETLLNEKNLNFEIEFRKEKEEKKAAAIDWDFTIRLAQNRDRLE